MGHTDTATTEQDVTNPARERAKYADPSGETMKALCWMGKDDVQVCKFLASITLSQLPVLMGLLLQWKRRNQGSLRTGM